MALRTEEKLQQLFQESRKRQGRKKLKEREAYRNASESIKKALADKLHINSPKRSQKPSKCPLWLSYESVHIYHSRLIERQADDDDLYSKEELQNIETLYPDEPGRINWNVYNRLVRKLRKELR